MRFDFCILLVLPSFALTFSTSELHRDASKTVGQPWPMPSNIQQTTAQLAISSENFDFDIVEKSCDILQAAIERYYSRIFQPSSKVFRSSSNKYLRYKYMPSKPVSLASVEKLSVYLSSACEEYPTLKSDESYKLQVDAGESTLTAESIWGILRGLETFSQLIYEDNEGTYFVNATTIEDMPRFAHRGLLVDTSRHFLRMHHLKDMLDAMEQNKMNVLHWHIVDDQSFPYESSLFPNLSIKGAYNKNNHVYTREDMKELVEYARIRGIRVVAEFDTPGHTQSWGPGQPDLLTPCYTQSGSPSGSYGPINPILNSTYTFLKSFMKEALDFFPDAYLHLGGDEVSFDCWKSNPAITSFMKQQGYGTDYSKLEQYYIQRLLQIVESIGGRYIIWQEPVDNGVKVASNTVVEVWKGGWQKELSKVTGLGLQAIISSPWYLDYISYGDGDWEARYKAEPYSFNGTAQQKQLVIGGEACLWAEYVDGTNFMSRMWPRAAAVAERLWSDAGVNDVNKAAPRLNEQRCRMIRRGLQAEPMNGPGFCQYEF